MKCVNKSWISWHEKKTAKGLFFFQFFPLQSGQKNLSKNFDTQCVFFAGVIAAAIVIYGLYVHLYRVCAEKMTFDACNGIKNLHGKQESVCTWCVCAGCLHFFFFHSFNLPNHNRSVCLTRARQKKPIYVSL